MWFSRKRIWKKMNFEFCIESGTNRKISVENCWLHLYWEMKLRTTLTPSLTLTLYFFGQQGYLRIWYVSLHEQKWFNFLIKLSSIGWEDKWQNWSQRAIKNNMWTISEFQTLNLPWRWNIPETMLRGTEFQILELGGSNTEGSSTEAFSLVGDKR